MHQTAAAPRIQKWPFAGADLLLVVGAYALYKQSVFPLGAWQLGVAALLIAAGAGAMIIPFILDYRALVRLAEAQTAAAAVPQIRQLEAIAEQISGATGRWQTAQDAADKTAAAARGVAEQMIAQVTDFKTFMERSNDSEKATLRVEVEKLRRGENEWLQVVVRTLDHVYALHQGAVRSGQPNLIEQLGQFQNACREIARRVGLSAFAPERAERFDPQRHELVDGSAVQDKSAAVEETVAVGYTFQGRLLRPALVKLRNGAPEGQPGSPETLSTG